MIDIENYLLHRASLSTASIYTHEVCSLWNVFIIVKFTHLKLQIIKDTSGVEWKIHYDDEGNIFYLNLENGETHWTIPMGEEEKELVGDQKNCDVTEIDEVPKLPSHVRTSIVLFEDDEEDAVSTSVLNQTRFQ